MVVVAVGEILVVTECVPGVVLFFMKLYKSFRVYRDPVVEFTVVGVRVPAKTKRDTTKIAVRIDKVIKKDFLFIYNSIICF